MNYGLHCSLPRKSVIWSINLHFVEFELKICIPNKYYNIVYFPIVNEGYVKIVETLIQKGANVNSKDVEKRTPLHVASMYGKLIKLENKIYYIHCKTFKIKE